MKSLPVNEHSIYSDAAVYVQQIFGHKVYVFLNKNNNEYIFVKYFWARQRAFSGLVLPDLHHLALFEFSHEYIRVQVKQPRAKTEVIAPVIGCICMAFIAQQ